MTTDTDKDAFEPLATIESKIDKNETSLEKKKQSTRLAIVHLLKKGKRQIEEGLHPEYADPQEWLKAKFGYAPTTMRDYLALMNSPDAEAKLTKQQESKRKSEADRRSTRGLPAGAVAELGRVIAKQDHYPDEVRLKTTVDAIAACKTNAVEDVVAYLRNDNMTTPEVIARLNLDTRSPVEVMEFNKLFGYDGSRPDANKIVQLPLPFALAA